MKNFEEYYLNERKSQQSIINEFLSNVLNMSDGLKKSSYFSVNKLFINMVKLFKEANEPASDLGKLPEEGDYVENISFNPDTNEIVFDLRMIGFFDSYCLESEIDKEIVKFFLQHDDKKNWYDDDQFCGYCSVACISTSSCVHVNIDNLYIVLEALKEVGYDFSKEKVVQFSYKTYHLIDFNKISKYIKNPFNKLRKPQEINNQYKSIIRSNIKDSPIQNLEMMKNYIKNNGGFEILNLEKKVPGFFSKEIIDYVYKSDPKLKDVEDFGLM